MRHELQDKIVDILSRCQDMTIATLAADGAPEATVVSFVHDGLIIYFGCGATSRKAANMDRDFRVSVAMTAPYREWLEIEGLSMSATAEPVTDPGESAQVGALMRDRFPQIGQIDVTSAESVRIYRIRPRIVSVLDYAKGFGHTDLVAVGADDIAASRHSMHHHWLVPAPPAG